MSETAFDAVVNYHRQTEILGSISGLLSWDMETKMANGSAHKRGEQLAVLSGLAHDRTSATELRELLERAREITTDKTRLRHLDLIQREVDKSTRVPKDLVTELARARIKSNQAWAAARHENDPSGFLPELANIIRLTRDYAAA
jgi:carboxypeptidase Taq